MNDAARIPISESRPVLVTGASGFLGSRLIARFETAGIPVVAALHRTPATFARARTCHADLGERKAVEGLIRNIRPSFIVHAAALTSTGLCEENPKAAERANVDAAFPLPPRSRYLGNKYSGEWLIYHVLRDFAWLEMREKKPEKRHREGVYGNDSMRKSSCSGRSPQRCRDPLEVFANKSFQGWKFI